MRTEARRRLSAGKPPFPYDRQIDEGQIMSADNEWDKVRKEHNDFWHQLKRTMPL